jgi:hypothetical protein
MRRGGGMKNVVINNQTCTYIGVGLLFAFICYLPYFENNGDTIKMK